MFHGYRTHSKDIMAAVNTKSHLKSRIRCTSNSVLYITDIATSGLFCLEDLQFSYNSIHDQYLWILTQISHMQIA
jgi:hypothetical protein